MIISVSIKNFRSLVDVPSLKLSDFVAISGDNDCGKSNILRALNLFFNHKTDFDVPFDFKTDFAHHHKTSQKKAKEITIELEIALPASYTSDGFDRVKWIKKFREFGSPIDERTLFKSSNRSSKKRFLRSQKFRHF